MQSAVTDVMSNNMVTDIADGSATIVSTNEPACTYVIDEIDWDAIE
jgi:hypothetical protein